MKRILSILVLLSLCFSARAYTITTITVSFTNTTTATVNGNTLTINGDTRTFTNSVFIPSSQIITNTAQNLSAANLQNHLADFPFANAKVGIPTSTTNVVIIGGTNIALTVSVSSGWAVVTAVTNSYGQDIAVIAPINAYPNPAQWTNVASAIVDAINKWATNSINASSETTGQVTSVCIPMGAWFTNNVGDGITITAASAESVTNTGDGFAFSDVVTNAIRARFALPWDWDGGTVRVAIQAICTGTNSGPGGATNVVFAVRAASNGLNDSAQQPTFGTAVWTTNHFGIGAYTNYLAVTANLTVGNSPSPGKSILWEIQRLGSQAGDTETNVDMIVNQVDVFLKRTPTTIFPIPTQ